MVKQCPNKAQLFTGIVAAVMFTCIAINRSVFKKRIRLIKQEPGLFRQLDAYRALYITRLAFAEASTLFAIIIAFITRRRPVWFLVAISILSAISLRPSKRRLIRELQLGSDDAHMLNDPEIMITEN